MFVGTFLRRCQGSLENAEKVLEEEFEKTAQTRAETSRLSTKKVPPGEEKEFLICRQAFKCTWPYWSDGSQHNLSAHNHYKRNVEHNKY